jgi:hypothetical protein
MMPLFVVIIRPGPVVPVVRPRPIISIITSLPVVAILTAWGRTVALFKNRAAPIAELRSISP